MTSVRGCPFIWAVLVQKKRKRKLTHCKVLKPDAVINTEFQMWYRSCCLPGGSLAQVGSSGFHRALRCPQLAVGQGWLMAEQERGLFSQMGTVVKSSLRTTTQPPASGAQWGADQHICLLLYYLLLNDSFRNTISFIKPFIAQLCVTLILSRYS